MFGALVLITHGGINDERIKQQPLCGIINRFVNRVKNHWTCEHFMALGICTYMDSSGCNSCSSFPDNHSEVFA